MGLSCSHTAAGSLMCRPSIRWARLSKGQKSSSDGTKKAFLDFQQETFFIPDGTDHDRDRRSASIKPTVAGSSDDGNDVQE